MHAPIVRDEDRRRGALALRATMSMWRRNQKQMASALGVCQSTYSRWADGEHDSRISACRAAVREMAEQGVYALPVVMDLAAELWTGAAVAKRSLKEVRERERTLRREHAELSRQVELWKLDVAEEVRRDEEQVDQMLLEFAARSLELYAIRQEIRLRERTER